MVFLLFLALALVIVFLFFFLLALHRHRPTLMLTLPGVPSHTPLFLRFLVLVLPLSSSSSSSLRHLDIFQTGFVPFFEGLFKDPFPIFQGLHSVRKRALSLCPFDNMNNFILKVSLGTWESGLNKVSTEIRGLSSTDCNFQGLSRCVQSGTLSNSHVCPLHLFLASLFPYYSSLLCYPV